MTREGSLRRARGTDLTAATALWLEITEHHASLDPYFTLRPSAAGPARQLLEALLRDPQVAIWVYEEGEELAGLCIARVDHAPPILEEVQRAEITDLGVRPAFRRRGIGRCLAREALAWIREQQVERVEVRVAVANREGQALWRSLGFGNFMDVLHLRL